MNSWHAAIGTFAQITKAVLANTKARYILLETMDAERIEVERTRGSTIC
jgi:hypothetical protein